MLLLVAMLLGVDYPPLSSVRQGRSLDGGTAWAVEVVRAATPVPTSQPDGGVLASDEALQRSANDLAAIRRLLEQLVQLQQQQAVQLQSLKDPGK